MASEIRIPVIAASAAFVLSIVTGLFARVGAGTLFLRALLFAALFGAGAFFIGVLARRFLPETFEEETDAVSSDDRIGTKIDIVLPGGESASDVPHEMEEVFDQGAVETEMGRLEEEVESIRAEPLLPAENERLSDAGGPARPIVSPEDLDILPDLEGFSESFSEIPSAENGGAEAPQTFGSSSRSSAEDSNATLYAKAIHTILQKDQKG